MLHNWLALEILSLTGLMILGKNCVLAPKLNWDKSEKYKSTFLIENNKLELLGGWDGMEQKCI